MNKQQIGVIGLAVMGKNLVLNIAEHGFSVSIYNRSNKKVDELLNEKNFDNIIGTYTIKEFVNSLEKPRIIILMVKAGNPVDETIQLLIPYLSKGDIIIDGGNSFYKDSIRRSAELEKKDLNFIGMGISGGEEGARKGPSIMPGGNIKTYQLVKEILVSISAKEIGRASCRERV